MSQILIEDGKGRGYKSEVDSYNRLRALVDTGTIDRRVNIRDGNDNGYWTGTIVAGPTNKFDFDNGDRASNGTGSFRVNNANVGSTAQFQETGVFSTSNYSSLSMRVNVDKNWSANQTDEFYLYGWNTSTNSQVGTEIALTDYIEEQNFDVWQSVNIPMSNMSLNTANIDAFRLECVAKNGGPQFYIDEFKLLEESETENIEFRCAPNRGERMYAEYLRINFIDANVGTLADATMPNLSYNKILNESALTNGIVIRRNEFGATKFSITVRQIWDLIKGGADIKNAISDGTNTAITIQIDFNDRIILDSRFDDSISFTISDDLSGLIDMNAEISGGIEYIEKLIV